MENILIVDDVAINREILTEILGDSYHILQAESGARALEIAYSKATDLSLILLDIVMPGMDGYEVLKLLKRSRATHRIPVMLISALDSEFDESRGLTEGAIDYIAKPFSAQIVKCRVRNHVNLKCYEDRLQEMANEQADKILRIRESVFDAVTSIVEYRSLESGKHVRRIQLYCEAQYRYMIAHQIHMSILDQRSAGLMARAASLHDIGKVGVPDRILLKPGKLTEDEYAIMKTHVNIGSNFLNSIADAVDEEYMAFARLICRHHHERWDGSGYPDGLAGPAIPLAARVTAVADVYDALRSRRIYKPAYSHEETCRLIFEGAGTQFDPDLVGVFRSIHSEFCHIADEHRDDGSIA